MEIKNKVALVTGSSSGIGEEIAVAYANQGALIALHGRNEEKLLNVKRRVDETRGTSHIFNYDLSIIGNAEKLYLDVIKIFNKNISILVNNAGFGIHGDIVNIPFDKYQEIINVNVITPIQLTKNVLPDMLKHGGKIINITSGIGVIGMPGISAYSLTKSAFTAFSESLFFETQGTKVDVISISPGLVNTFFADNIAQYGNIKEKLAEGSKRSPKDIAKLVLKMSATRNGFLDLSRSRLIGILKYCLPSLLHKIIIMKTRN